MSPFVFWRGTAKPGQPLTGIDAALANDKFYGTFTPSPSDYPDPGPGAQFITAWKPTRSEPSGFLYDAADSFVGGFSPSDATVVTGPYGGAFNPTYYTKWTAVAPPTHVPELDATGVGSAATLLAVTLAWLRGRRAAG